MRRINIEKVSTIEGRPYSISLEGSLGHDKFKAELAGVNLDIKTPVPFNEKQISSIEEKLQDIFPPMYDGKFTKEYLDDIMKRHRNFVQIEVK